jgi:hypothetical protein
VTLHAIDSSKRFELFSCCGRITMWTLALLVALAVCASATVCPAQERQLDLVLLVDSSGSVGSDNWRNLKNFAASIVDKLNIGEDATRFVVAPTIAL